MPASQLIVQNEESRAGFKGQRDYFGLAAIKVRQQCSAHRIGEGRNVYPIGFLEGI